MNITEYNSKNEGKQVIVLRKDDIKTLNHFASIAKSGELKGLIVAGKYVGFTDTYRLATLKDTHEDLPGTNTATPLMYDVLDVLKVVEDLEYESHSEAYPLINFTENVVWKMLKPVGEKEYFTRFFNFENGKSIC